MKKGMFDRGQEPPHRLLASKSKAPVTLKSIVLYVAIVINLKYATDINSGIDHYKLEQHNKQIGRAHV